MSREQPTMQDFLAACQVIGVTPLFLRQQYHSKEAFESAYETFLDRAHRTYRRQMAQVHPDKPAGNEADAKALNQAFELITSVQIEIRRPDPQPIRVVFYTGGAWQSSGTTNTTTTDGTSTW